MANYFSDPNTLALLGMAGGLLEAGGPSRTPVSLGQGLSRGFSQGLGFAQMGAQNQERQAQQEAFARTQQAINSYGASLPQEQRSLFYADPKAFIKAMNEGFTLKPGDTRFQGGKSIASLPYDQNAPQTQFAPSSLGKLIQERNALPPDSPLRSSYDKAIKNASEAQERSPSIQFFPGIDNLYGLNRRTGEAKPVTGVGGAPLIAPQNDPRLQGRIAESKAAGRESGEARTQAGIDLPRVIDSAENSIQLIDQMVGSRLPDGGRGQPHPGFGSAIGLRVPGWTRVPGTEAANFQALLEQVKGGAFLEAFNSLKGGGQITEVEGKKATDAITRMSNAQTEREFIKAAREYQEIIEKGVDRAKIKAGVAPERRTEPRSTSRRVIVDY